MFCENCGNTLKPGAKFCGQCGNPVAAQKEPVESNLQAPGEAEGGITSQEWFKTLQSGASAAATQGKQLAQKGAQWAKTDGKRMAQEGLSTAKQGLARAKEEAIKAKAAAAQSLDEVDDWESVDYAQEEIEQPIHRSAQAQQSGGARLASKSKKQEPRQGKTILKAALLFAMVMFFFPFCTVSCSSVDVGSYTGIELIKGIEVSGYSSSDYGVYLGAAFVFVLVGFVLSFVKLQNSALGLKISRVLAFFAFLCMVLCNSTLKSALSKANQWVTVVSAEVHMAPKLACLAMLVAALSGFLAKLLLSVGIFKSNSAQAQARQPRPAAQDDFDDFDDM